MKNCKYCKVQVNTDKERCPVCKSALEGEAGENFVSEFPSLQPPEKDVLLRRIFNLILVGLMGFFAVSLIIVLTGWVHADNSGWWAFLFGLSVTGAFAITRNAVLSNESTERRIFVASMLALIEAILIDAFFFHIFHANPEVPIEWSLIFVLPAIPTGLIITYTVLMFVNRKSMNDYYVYMFFAILANFAPLIVYSVWGIGYNFVAYSCVILNLVTVLMFSAINLRSIVEEIKKKMHI